MSSLMRHIIRGHGVRTSESMTRGRSVVPASSTNDRTSDGEHGVMWLRVHLARAPARAVAGGSRMGRRTRRLVAMNAKRRRFARTLMTGPSLGRLEAARGLVGGRPSGFRRKLLVWSLAFARGTGY